MKEFFKDSKNIIILALIVAIIGSVFYWYACMNKGMCKIGGGIKGDKKTEMSKDVPVLDGKTVFENISKNPLVVYFDASTTMPVTAQIDSELKALSKYAIDNNKNIYITGHSKNIGNWTKSNEVSLSNAKAVKDLLVSYGATSSKVYASGKSSNFPVYNHKGTDDVNNRAVISVDSVK